MKKFSIFATLAAILLTATFSLAQPHGSGHSGRDTMKTAAPTNAKEAYEAANAKMHKDMTITFSGDADADFARSMIAHHQGAIDMARVVLQYGKSPQLKQLAGEIIKAQETEITFMTSWLATNAK